MEGKMRRLFRGRIKLGGAFMVSRCMVRARNIVLDLMVSFNQTRWWSDWLSFTNGAGIYPAGP